MTPEFLLSLAIQCDRPWEALRSLTHINWNLTTYNIPFAERQRDPFIYIFGDEITLTCEPGYMFAKNKVTFSYVCAQNGSSGVWKPETTNYLPACPGVFFLIITRIKMM